MTANKVFDIICSLLIKHGFEKANNGDMVRPSTGCGFPKESLMEYESVMDFQLDWPYA